jgi:hypothetical protein
MMSAMKFSGRFARALLNGTREELFVPTTTPRPRGTTETQQSMMGQETDELLRHVDSIKANYGNDILDLTCSMQICATTSRQRPSTSVFSEASRGKLWRHLNNSLTDTSETSIGDQ